MHRLQTQTIFLLVLILYRLWSLWNKD